MIFFLLQASLESQGNFVPEGRHDILVEAIGRHEHCGRVRAAGQGVEIKLYFWSFITTFILPSPHKESKAKNED